MSLAVERQEIPLHTSLDGVICVAATRITLDTLVETFNDGATPEEIGQQYPSLHLADIYAVIGYYLHHRKEVDAYLAERSDQRDHVRKDNESRFSPKGVRERLLARRSVA